MLVKSMPWFLNKVLLWYDKFYQYTTLNNRVVRLCSIFRSASNAVVLMLQLLVLSEVGVEITI